VIGSGSLSFELVRALTERLPVMITPRWVSVATQPIAIEDLVAYLLAALDLEVDASDHQVFEIGGTDQVCYRDIMREYARQRHLRRLMLSVPVLTPRLSSLWRGLVTPVYARVGRKLIASMRHPTVVRDTSALDTFAIRPQFDCATAPTEGEFGLKGAASTIFQHHFRLKGTPLSSSHVGGGQAEIRNWRSGSGG
jgi:uncharacterized protein YbjT (DUF2867 family)